MVIFLYGEDSFRRKKKYAEIISEFMAKNGNLGFSDFSSDELEKFIETIKTGSIFSQKTLIGIKDINIGELSTKSFKSLKDAIYNKLSHKDIIILISSEELSLPPNMPFLYEPPVKTQEFSELPKEKKSLFILKEALSKEIVLSKMDSYALIDYFSGDLWAINSELDKLSLVKNKELLLVSAETHNYFQLLNLIKSEKGRAKKLIALEIILYKLKEDPAKVFNSLAYSPPKNVLPDIWFEQMADYDVAVKSGRMDYEEALLDLVIR